MPKSVAELRKLINLARKSGLKSLSFDGVSFEFDQSKQPATNNQVGSLAPLSSDDAVMPRDDELLYASSPYYDQLKSQREEANKPQEN